MGEKTGDNAGLGNGAAYDAYVVRDPEALARNIARMIEEAGKAASVWLAPRESGAKIDPAGDAFGQMMGTLSKVSEYWLSDPARTMEAQAALFSGFVNIWSRSLARMGGEVGNSTHALH
jgi:polyhydroxyalkanoate synthase subunit PhaC